MTRQSSSDNVTRRASSADPYRRVRRRRQLDRHAPRRVSGRLVGGVRLPVLPGRTLLPQRHGHGYARAVPAAPPLPPGLRRARALRATAALPRGHRRAEGRRLRPQHRRRRGRGRHNTSPFQLNSFSLTPVHLHQFPYTPRAVKLRSDGAPSAAALGGGIFLMVAAVYRAGLWYTRTLRRQGIRAQRTVAGPAGGNPPRHPHAF